MKRICFFCLLLLLVATLLGQSNPVIKQTEKVVSRAGSYQVAQSSNTAADDYPRSVAAAIVQLVSAGDANFEQIKGPLKSDGPEMKQWQVSVMVPGFQCSLNESRGKLHVYCAADQKADTGERNHLAIARALAEQLRPMAYSCESEAAEPSTIPINLVPIHEFRFRRSFGDSYVTQYLNTYIDSGFQIKPPGSFNISFLVNSPLDVPAKTPIHEPPLECDYSYSALESHERNTLAGEGVRSAAGQGGGIDRNRFLMRLNGEWRCDTASACQKARVEISGDGGRLDKFSAAIDLEFSSNNGWTCNRSSDGNCSWLLTGIIDGLSIDGTAQEPSLHYKKGCDTPHQAHRFDGTISDDGRRIVIHTELNAYAPWGSKWIWSKDIVRCEEVRVDRTDSLMMVLRSDRPDPNPIGIEQPVSGSGSGGHISAEIDGIVNSGRYSTLPPSQFLFGVGSGSQQASLSFENQTPYDLTVLVAGPIERAITVSAGGSQQVVLQAGTYRVLGRVKSSDVLPFFGTQTYVTGSSYRESFFIK